MKPRPRALVLLSGGQDSTTALFWAKETFGTVATISFNYGQRHIVELYSAKKVSDMAEAVSHEVIDARFISQLSKSALTSAIPIQHPDAQLPNTFVQGRNIFFLSIAAVRAKEMDIHVLVGGMCQTDYSGYPDCRRDFIDSMEKSLSFGLDYQIKIETPLMYLTKAQSVELAQVVGAMEALKHSHTCYNGYYPPCGTCPACLLRAKGFKEAGIQDPIFNR